MEALLTIVACWRRFSLIQAVDLYRLPWLVVNGSTGLAKLCFVIQSITCPFNVPVTWLTSSRQESLCKDTELSSPSPTRQIRSTAICFSAIIFSAWNSHFRVCFYVCLFVLTSNRFWNIKIRYFRSFLKKKIEDKSPFCGATHTPVLDFLWHLPWVLKPGYIPCLLSHLCNPHVHIWCVTCWLYRGQHYSQAFLIHILADHVSTLMEVWVGTHDHRCGEHSAVNHMKARSWILLLVGLITLYPSTCEQLLPSIYFGDIIWHESATNILIT